MAAIPLQSPVLSNNGPVVMNVSTLTLSDTLTYNQGAGQKMYVRNPTGGVVTLTLAGTTPNTSIDIPGFGGSVSAAGGKAIVIAQGSQVFIDLDDLYQFLAPTGGTVTLTSTVAGLVVSHYN